MVVNFCLSCPVALKKALGGAPTVDPTKLTILQEVPGKELVAVWSHEELGKYVLKIFTKARISQHRRHQIDREIHLHRDLHHPFVVEMYAHWEDEAHIFLLLEYLSEGDLFEAAVGKEMPEHRAVRRVIKPLLQALTYLHARKIVHRDLKMENLLRTPNAIKLADFGLSISHEEERPVTRVGTLDYMAPEVLNAGLKDPNTNKYLLEYGTPVDIWAVGVLCYELLCGRAPFYAKTVDEMKQAVARGCTFPPSMGPEAALFISSCLHPDPAARPSAADLLTHPFIATYSTSLPGLRRSSQSPAHHATPSRRHRNSVDSLHKAAFSGALTPSSRDAHSSPRTPAGRPPVPSPLAGSYSAAAPVMVPVAGEGAPRERLAVSVDMERASLQKAHIPSGTADGSAHRGLGPRNKSAAGQMDCDSSVSPASRIASRVAPAYPVTSTVCVVRDPSTSPPQDKSKNGIGIFRAINSLWNRRHSRKNLGEAPAPLTPEPRPEALTILKEVTPAMRREYLLAHCPSSSGRSSTSGWSVTDSLSDSNFFSSSNSNLASGGTGAISNATLSKMACARSKARLAGSGHTTPSDLPLYEAHPSPRGASRFSVERAGLNRERSTPIASALGPQSNGSLRGPVGALAVSSGRNDRGQMSTTNITFKF